MYIPSKTELKLLKLVYHHGRLYNGIKAFDLLKAKQMLNLSGEEIYFTTQNPTPLLNFDGQRALMTNEGNVFMENYRYNILKELAFWFFGIAAIVAALFSIITVLQ